MKDQFRVTQLFDDPSDGYQINQGFINGCLPIALKTEVSDKNKEELVKLILTLGVKLSSLWNLKVSYEKRLEDIVNEIKKDKSREERKITDYSVQSTDLMGWVDMYFTQTKSTLDLMVKIPSPIFGYKHWNLATFGKKGETVKSAFKNLPKKYKGPTSNYYEAIFEDSDWLIDIIETRDKFNHGIKGGINPEIFTVIFDKQTKKCHEPMWSKDQSFREFMDVMFAKMLNLTSIFTGLMMNFAVPKDMIVVCDASEAKKTRPICKLTNKKSFKEHLQRHGIKESPY